MDHMGAAFFVNGLGNTGAAAGEAEGNEGERAHDVVPGLLRRLLRNQHQFAVSCRGWLFARGVAAAQYSAMAQMRKQIRVLIFMTI
jgi:hypothetical protein